MQQAERPPGQSRTRPQSVPSSTRAISRYEYTVRGDTVNEAARLSDVAKSLPSGIAASAEVVEVGDGERSWQPAGRTRLRGMKADIPYHVPSETR